MEVNPPAPVRVNPDASRSGGAGGSGGTVRRGQTDRDDCVDNADRPPATSGAAPLPNNRYRNRSDPGRSDCKAELGRGKARRERNDPKTPSALVITPMSVGLDGIVRTLENDRAFPLTRERWGASRNETWRLKAVARPGLFGGAIVTAPLPSALSSRYVFTLRFILPSGLNRSLNAFVAVYTRFFTAIHTWPK
jgi:hypothetical protein